MARHDADVTLSVNLDTSQVQSQADHLRNRIETIFRKTDGKQMSASFVRLKQNMRDVYTESERVGQQLATLDRQGTVKQVTEEYARWQTELQRVEAELARVQEQMQIEQYLHPGGSNRYNVLRQQEVTQQLLQARAIQNMQQLEDSGRAYNNVLASTTPRYQELLQRQAQLNDRMQIAVLRAGQMQGAVSKSVHPFRSMHSAVQKVSHAIGKLVSGVKSLVNRLRGVNTGAEDAGKSLKKLAKFALKYFLGLRSIFILYKRIRSAGVEAYKGLASQFPELNAELNSLKNSFFQLKNSIATMAQPILSALVPAIKTLMSWLTAAMNALANFFAILTGAKYVYKAAKANKDWAKSASGAGKAAKEANEDIAEYDNLILIQQDKDSGGGGGGGEADEYAGAWEKVEAESDFAQKLKEAINAGNWEEVGDLFAKKLNGVVDRFDNWINDTFRPKGKMWADRIGRILNGLTDGFDAKKLGTTLADGVNAIFDIFNTFLKRYDFKKLGTRVGEAITGFFTRLDPKLIGNTLANKFNAAINFWAGVIKSTDFKIIGSRIGVALKTLIEDIEWAQLGANLSDLAAGILEGLSQFIIDSDLGVTVGNAINEFLSKIDFGRLMKDLSDLAINILNALADAIETVDWEMVGQAIADMLKNIDWGKFLTALARVALGLIKGLGTALLQIATDPEALGSLATGLLAIFGAKWIWNKIAGLFKTGLTGAITQGAAGAGGGGAIGGWLSRVFKTNLGTGAAGWLGSIAQGLIGGVATYQGVGSIAGSVGSVLANVFSQDDALIAEYQKFSKNAIGYTVDAIQEAVEAGQEYSETTGKKTLANAWSMMWGGTDVTEIAKQKTAEALKASEEQFERAKLGWSKEKGGIGREVTDTEWFAYKWSDTVADMRQVSEEAFFGIGASFNILGQELQKTVDAGRESLGMLQTDSNHYAEIAKQNAKSVRDTTKIAEDSSNHYVEIAKQNAGYSEKIKQEAIDSSNHYAQIAQAQAQGVTTTAQTAEQSSNHYVEIAKTNAGYYEKIQQEMIDSSNHYVDIAKQNAGIVAEDATGMVNDIEGAVATIPDSFDTTFGTAYDKVTSSFEGTKSYFKDVAEGVKTPFGTMADFFHDTFSDSWSGVVDVFQTDTPQFQSIQDSISGSFKTMINGMITGVNNSISSPFQTLSNLVSRLKGMTVGDSKIFSALPSISVPTIPRLAQGAVLPPNNPFIAMVGDQKSGTNVEAPLETIAEALRQVLSENHTTQNQTIVLQLNGRQVAQAVWDEENKRYKQTGARFSYS